MNVFAAALIEEVVDLRAHLDLEVGEACPRSQRRLRPCLAASGRGARWTDQRAERALASLHVVGDLLDVGQRAVELGERLFEPRATPFPTSPSFSPTIFLIDAIDVAHVVRDHLDVLDDVG